jgi:hypothetical protein
MAARELGGLSLSDALDLCGPEVGAEREWVAEAAADFGQTAQIV